MLSLGATALAVFWASYALDYYLVSTPGLRQKSVFGYFLDFDPDHIDDATSSLGAMTAAVFGIVITVVSIVVQLSADRYTGVARMFLRDRVNLTVMSYYVVATVVGLWLSLGLRTGFAPRATLLVMLLGATGALVLMGPYFGYVFWFLEPTNVIERIRREGVRVAFRGATEQSPERLATAQAAALSAMEELTDITNNSISSQDKIIASAAVDALKDFGLEYLEYKPRASAAWFRVGSAIRHHPDFVAMDPESLHDLEQSRTWVEWKVMRQYLGIYREALGPMRDINYLVAINTRYLGEAAQAAGDQELERLVVRYMNSYLRAALNARDVRTAYNVLNQYRLLVEAMLRARQGRLALEGVAHMLYYGHLSFDLTLTFVTETVAYDVSALCQYANELGSPEEEEMLSQFLQLDRPLRVRSQEKALLGVRKAQVKLATYYLERGEKDKARLIWQDMTGEPVERLTQIRSELERVVSKDFWEIIDRGRNFEYLPPGQRARLDEFFGWFEH